MAAASPSLVLAGHQLPRRHTSHASASFLPPPSPEPKLVKARDRLLHLPWRWRCWRTRAVEDALHGATRQEEAAAEVVEQVPEQQDEEEEDLEDGSTARCGGCRGRGWLLCGLCEGKKTNVKSSGNRIYRRCPTCKAVGYVLCPSCRVYKCITYPDVNDGELS